MCAQVGSREAGAVTAAVAYYAVPKVLFEVSRGSFLPAPKVDSAVIRLDLLEQPPVKIKSEKDFFRLIKAAFAQRRKTFVNSVASAGGLPKEVLTAALERQEINPLIRAEKLTLEQLAMLSDEIF